MISCKGEEFEGILSEVCSFYKDDFDRDLLCTQLQTFHVLCRKEHVGDVSTMTIFDLKKFFSSLCSGQTLRFLALGS